LSLSPTLSRRRNLLPSPPDAITGGSRLSDVSFGWSGAYGTHFWVDPKEDLIAIMMIQTPVREMRPEFENAVMQAVIK
jgi:CubicO group peptidase (beta-lactamase class C family)